MPTNEQERVEREIAEWESLDAAIIDDAYDGSGVLNRPGRGSVVINSKEDCDEIAADHNSAVSQARREERERLTEISKKLDSLRNCGMRAQVIVAETKELIAAAIRGLSDRLEEK